jgi:hypothetical protein
MEWSCTVFHRNNDCVWSNQRLHLLGAVCSKEAGQL